MSIFFAYIRDFLKTVDSLLLIAITAFVALIIFLNYRYGIEPKILYNISNRLYRFSGFYLVYLVAFAVPYLLLFIFRGVHVTDWKLFIVLILVSPAIFAIKVNFNAVSEWVTYNVGGSAGRYYAVIVNLPSKLIAVSILLAGLWWTGSFDPPFFGLTAKNLKWSPYIIMLLIMIPLIAWASAQSDFLHTYPKLKQVYFIDNYFKSTWLYKLLYEISYGIDFVTIELFFRGFLVLAFVRFAGQEAILPMAVFYCSIHFGKPLAECISSFFGGLILGIIVYHTKSIWGGLMIHLGIAWLMEAGAILGHYFKQT